jgi:hypothetical protein
MGKDGPNSAYTKMHKRRQIRAAIKTAILAISDFGSRVDTNRPDPYLQTQDYPFAAIYNTEPEAAVLLDISESTLKRSAIIGIEIRTSGPGIDDALDDLADLVEQALKADFTLGGLAVNSQLSSTTGPELDPEAKKVIGAIRLDYEITYLY